MKISIGRLVNFHGIRGEVKVLSDSDFAEDRFSPGSSVEVKGTAYTIDSYRKHKNFHMLRFEGVGNINEVEHLKGSEVLQEAEAVELPLDEGEYHYRDIIGLEVLLEGTLESIGKISDIFETGANDVWVVDGEKQYMIPYIEDVVKDIDLEQNRIIIHPMEGLLD